MEKRDRQGEGIEARGKKKKREAGRTSFADDREASFDRLEMKLDVVCACDEEGDRSISVVQQLRAETRVGTTHGGGANAALEAS